MKSSNIVCDIGGTTTRVARANAIAHAVVFPTDPDPVGEAGRIAGAVASLGESSIEHVVCGLAGVIGESSIVHTAPNLPLYKGSRFRDALEQALQARVRIANDAYLGALGESLYGAGRGHEIVAYIAVGTGVGGARVVVQSADKARFGQEPGHMPIFHQGEVHELEEWIGGRAVAHRYGQSPKTMTDVVVWNELGAILGEALWTLTLTWSPDIFVFGGSMMLGSPGISLARAAEELSKHNHLYPRLPELKKAELGDFPVLWGAKVVAESEKR